MTEETKKQILLHLPYLVFVYLFDKIAQGFRLSYGVDFGTRLLHFPEGLSESFSSPLISFHLSDLFIGIIAAVLIRLAVYVKGKNAKKYRKGTEYGSARFGNKKDINPYMDPVFRNNIPLTKTECITMNSRPKNPKYARNKNILVVGGSGSGKTRFFVKPSLM